MKKINLNNSMQTLTQTTTKVVSSTALIVATFALFGTGAIALASVPVSKTPGGTNTVKVYTCKAVKNGILIKANTRSKATTLINGCKKIGQTKRDYTYTCASNRKSYKAKWQACATKTTATKIVTPETTGTTIDTVVDNKATQDVIKSETAVISTTETNTSAKVESVVAPEVGCADSDAKTSFSDLQQLFTKSTTKVNGVAQKEDYCVGNYLFEGICYKDSFTFWQKNCAELNVGKPENNFLCVDGTCVNQPK